MSFVRLVVKSVVYPTLLVLLAFGVWLFYFHFFAYSEHPAPSAWNWNKTIHVPCHTSFSFIETNGIRLNVLEAGPKTGKLLIFLHGFPETAFLSWHNQICFFADRGYHFVAPDLRGYNTSDKPPLVSDYRLAHTSADVIGLLDHFKAEKGIVIGHDWGAALAWWVALHYPNRVEKLGILNVPHPVAFREFLFGDFAQMRKSWYIFYFQLPYIVEEKIVRNNFTFGLGVLAGSSEPGQTFSYQSVPRYMQAWSEPNALGSMLNWYRAALRYRDDIADPRVKMRTQIIWGKKDIALDHRMVSPSAALCDRPAVVFFENATHWVQHDKPDEVNKVLLTFIETNN